MMKIKMRVEKTRTGFSAYAKSYAAFTTGTSIEDLQTNIVEALNLLFEGKRFVNKRDLVLQEI